MKNALCLCLLLLPLAAIAQNRLIDSLEQVLQSNSQDTVRVDALNRLTHVLKYSEPERALTLSAEAEKLARELSYYKGLAATFYSRAYVLQGQGEYETAVAVVGQGLEIAREIADTNRQAYCHGLLGIIYGKWTDLEKSLANNLRARELFAALKDTVTLTAINTNIGTIYEERGQYDTALVYYFESLRHKRQQGKRGASIVELANIGAAYYQLGDYTLALDYNQQGIAQSMLNPNKPLLDHFYANRGQVFLAQEILDSASHYAHAAYELTRDGKRPYRLLSVLKLLGELEYERQNLELASLYWQRGFELATELGNLDFQSAVGCRLGEMLLEQGEMSSAIDVLETAYRIGEEMASYPRVACASEQLSVAHEQIGQHENALRYARLFHAYQDSLGALEKNKYVLELERKFRTANQAQQLAEQELTINQQDSRFRTGVLLALVLLLILLAFIQYRRYRTKAREREAQLRLQTEQYKVKELAALDQLKSTFFANISHEFRTPLTLILGPVQEALQQHFADNKDANDRPVSVKPRYLQLIENNALRLLQLINQLLDLSRLEAKQEKLELRSGDLLRFLRAVVFSFESQAERRAIDYQAKFPDQLSEALFSRDHWEKILVNLLSNAFKFTPDSGQLSFEATELPEGLGVIIQDSGPGIPEEEVPYIFDRFYQVEGTMDQGTGIGLALVKELVDLLDGTIDVESNDQGTSFRLLLPYLPEHFPDREIHILPEVESEMSNRSQVLSPTTTVAHAAAATDEDTSLVLIVEDNADLRAYIAEQLGQGYRIMTAPDGLQGLADARAHTPDLVISDVMMPKMDGFALCEELKTDEKTSHIPVILLTAKAGQEHKLTGLKTGADEYLTKPFDGRELRLRVQNMIRQRTELRAHYSQSRRLMPAQIAVTSADEQFLEKVQQTIEDNLSNEFFSVEELAAAVAFSRSQLHRKLKALTGQSPNLIIRDFRMQRAKQLLEQGAGNVSEVALAVGYGNFSYFAKMFKATFGILPSEVK